MKKKIVLASILVLIIVVLGILISNWKINKINLKSGSLFEIETPYKNYPPIPDGYAYKEGTVETGYVIQDANENEFVWIPIDGTNIKQSRIDFGTGNTLITETSETISEEMQNSIDTYRGFWIGRYEASSNGVSKAGEIPATVITRDEAKKICSSYDSGENAVGHLIYGQEWDMAIQFVQTTNKEYSTSESAGNYGTEIIKTGESGDKQNNIYDLSRKCKRVDTRRKNE